MSRLAVSVGGQLQSEVPWSINYNYATSGGDPTSAQLATIAQAAFATLTADANVLKLIGSASKFSQVRMTYHNPNNAVASASGVSTGAAVAGTGLNSVPPQVAVVATLRSGIPGRRYRGRLFVPGEGVSIPANGIITSATQGVINTGVQNISHAILTALAASGFSGSWCVYSRVGNVLTPLTGISVGNRVDTQRRRLDAASDSYTNFPLT